MAHKKERFCSYDIARFTWFSILTLTLLEKEEKKISISISNIFDQLMASPSDCAGISIFFL